MSTERRSIQCVLLDIGGTIWPDAGPAASLADEVRVSRFARLFPHLEPDQLMALIDRLRRIGEGEAAVEAGGDFAQRTEQLVAEGMRAAALPANTVTAQHLIAAMCLPAVPGTALFPGAVELLQALKSRGVKVVALSNVQWRAAASYRTDFAALGVAWYFDGVVTSLDSGYRKPHRAIFEEAMGLAGADAAGSVMVGNSEYRDIVPAVKLGMLALRVAIEEGPPAASAAHAVATSLRQASEVLCDWIGSGRR